MAAPAKSILELSQALSGDNNKVFDLCARIGFLADSLAPLEKLQTLGFTPEAISDLYTACGENTDLMLRTIQELE
jgi:hypothetical protein